MSNHRSMVDIASKAMSLTHWTGVHQKALGYPTPSFNEEDQLTYVNPTVRIMNKVSFFIAPWNTYPLTCTEQIQYAFIILMVLAFGLIKLSITFYYRRIFVIARGVLFDWITKAAITVVVLWTVGCLSGFIFSCGTHISANWSNFEDIKMYCGPSLDVENAFVVSDLITDVMVLCLPLPVVSTRVNFSL